MSLVVSAPLPSRARAFHNRSSTVGEAKLCHIPPMMGHGNGRHPIFNSDPRRMASILGWLDSQNVGRLGGKPIWYGAGLLDASQTMLTPSTERTEEGLEGGLNSPDPHKTRHCFRSLGSTSGGRGQSVCDQDRKTPPALTLHNSGMEMDYLFSTVTTHDRLPAPARWR